MKEQALSKNHIQTTAMVIGNQPVGEYDRRVVLLTKDYGKISAFARGARRPKSSLISATNVFSFGEYRFYAGRDSYTLVEANVQNHFEYFMAHVEASLLGQYFCEVLDYCTRENNDESQLLLLLYQSLRALESERFARSFVRSVFEIKTVSLEGELKQPNENEFLPATLMALRYIDHTGIARLFSFDLADTAKEQLSLLARWEMNQLFEYHHFKSLDILDMMDV